MMYTNVLFFGYIFAYGILRARFRPVFPPCTESLHHAPPPKWPLIVYPEDADVPAFQRHRVPYNKTGYFNRWRNMVYYRPAGGTPGSG